MSAIPASARSIALAPRGLVLLVLGLFLLVLASAIAVVTVSHHSRVYHGQLAFVEKQNFDLQGEASRIALEYEALASLATIQQQAQEQLSMHIVAPSHMVVLP